MPEDPHAAQSLTLEEIVAQDAATALYLPLAERLRERGRVEEAIRLCEERRQRPGSGVGDHIVLGRCYLADGRLGNAKAEFEGALALDRENVVALKALAGIVAHEGNHTKAADLYRAVCRVDPGDLESQTALQQITSGEYPEVRPPDVIVAQGDSNWQPVRIPREEEHLGEIGLGLRTIETFDTLHEAPSAPMPGASEIVELSIDELERIVVPAAPEAAAPPEATAPAPPPVVLREPEIGTIGAPPALEEEAPKPAPRGVNRSAFEEWLRRLAGNG
ncbi:MAG: tetratricopeptide repeat protein [Hyphomicrobiales bacterium]